MVDPTLSWTHVDFRIRSAHKHGFFSMDGDFLILEKSERQS